jgi:uncharacterized membrane protein
MIAARIYAGADRYWARFAVGLATVLAFDGLWLGLLAPALGVYAGKYQAVPGRGAVAILLYAVLSAAVSAAVVAPTASLAAAVGALLGLLAFGTFNLTHWALTRKWDAVTATIDTMYGVCAWTLMLSVQHLATSRS